MKKILLVQPNYNVGPKELNAYYLPYSIGILWSYARQSKYVAENYSLEDIIWKRGNNVDILDLCKKYKDVDIFAFSAYIWNKNWIYEFSKLIKQINPNCITIYGGPEIPISNPNLFVDYPFMDYVVKSEGEFTFKNLLEDFDNAENIPGLLINHNGKIINTGNAKRINDLNVIPSPYLDGLFDDILKNNPDVEWNAIMETNRGCPYSCTFCDWGSLTYSKVKKFELQRVFDELEWLSKNKISFISIADANFGIFVERDNIIADKIAEMQQLCGYPKTFSVSWAKSQKESVVNIVKKFTGNKKTNMGLTISVQSMNEEVLENIKRKNLEQHNIEKMLKMCSEFKIPTYTELILGLPGETLETWKNNFWTLFDARVHNGISIYQAQLLENAEMNLKQVDEYDITSIEAFDYLSGSYADDEIREGVKIVTSTKDMNFEEMIEAEIFGWFINTFHINGMTTKIAEFLHHNKNISYEKFYETLFEYLKKNKWFNKEIEDTKSYYETWLTVGETFHPKIGNIEIHGWNLINRTTILLNAENKVNEIYDLISRMLDKFIDNKKIIEELILYQKNIYVQYDNIKEYPKNIKFNYNFFDNKDEPVEINFDFPEDKNMSKEMFLEQIYFGRKRQFGIAHLNKV